MEVWGGNELLSSAIAVPGLDIHVYSQPYHGEAAGGDVMYVSSCGMGRIARLLLADVSGHGGRVADLARVLRDIMRRYINHVDQSKFVSALNHEFAAAATTGRFATAIVATYWAETDCLTATSAGHPRPIWYRARNNTWVVLSDCNRDGRGETLANLPLGVEERTRYEQVMLRLSPGDVLLLYSDSVTEASDPAGGMLGEQGLLALLGQLDATRPQELVRRLVEGVCDFRGGREAEDDMTVVAVVCSGRKPRRSLWKKIGSMASIGRAIVARMLGRHGPVPWPEMSAVSILGMFIRPINRLWGGGLRPGEVRTGAAARRAPGRP